MTSDVKPTLSPAEITAYRSNLDPILTASAQLRDLAFRSLTASENLTRQDLLNYFISECMSAINEGRNLFEVGDAYKTLRHELEFEIYDSLKAENEKPHKYVNSVVALVHAEIASLQEQLEEDPSGNYDALFQSLALATTIFPHQFEEAAFKPKDKARLILIKQLDPEFIVRIDIYGKPNRDAEHIGRHLAYEYLAGFHQPDKYAFVFDSSMSSAEIDDEVRLSILRGFVGGAYDRVHPDKYVTHYPLSPDPGVDVVELLSRDFGEIISPDNEELVEAIQGCRKSYAPFLVPIVENQLFRRGFSTSEHYAAFLLGELTKSNENTELPNMPYREVRRFVELCDVICHSQDPYASVAYINELVRFMVPEDWDAVKALASLNPVPSKKNGQKDLLRRWLRIDELRREELIEIAGEIAEYRKNDIAAGFQDVKEAVGDEITNQEATYVMEMYARLSMPEQDRVRAARTLFKTTHRRDLASGLSSLVGVSDNPDVVRKVVYALRRDLLNTISKAANVVSKEERTAHTIERLAQAIRESSPYYGFKPEHVLSPEITF